MYTQCPDCEIAFRVTAEVLKQAAGKVRCGGCGNPFNALDYLSEQMPKQPTPKVADAALPELTPEIIETDNGLPQTISAEQSAALLKTLDELAGSDIRIEDTGLEWRVFDDQESATSSADNDAADPVRHSDDIDESLDSNETPIDEIRFDDDTPLPDDFDLDDESSAVSVAEQDASEDIEELSDDALAEEPQPDIVLSEPDEWQDILGEFQELADDIAAPMDEIAEELGEIEDAKASTPDEPLDMDSQFALQAEAMGIDLSGVHELDSEDEQADEELEDGPVEELEDEADELELEDELGQLEQIAEQRELIQEPIVESHTIEEELAADDSNIDADNDSDEHYVPPMTEEEHTANMQIDQELMALAIEDEDGFASTIVIPGKDSKEKAQQEIDDTADVDGSDTSDSAPGFETIIMEGEFVRSAIDSQKLAEDSAAAAALVELARAEESKQARRSGGARYGILVGSVVLVLALTFQVIHQSRDALATIPAFGDTIGLVYRAIGQPVQPAWDITGWRFEATKGSATGDDEELTVYSRLGNNSDGPLPYPLIGISLTDRFEETIGSRVLDPAEYLPTDLDPRELVEPGNTFNAIITIKSATEDATGFKLNVCYRLSDEQLRCAIDDFR